ncbi:MAG TPA: glutamate--tRNA ligase [Firmicutes bacterium]|nr:glutamate--tRNA ligase [Bacillota bacterium]
MSTEDRRPSKRVRTRFAPSPTGRLHLGNVHTALFAWLFARRNGGEFIVRFEDTDAERLVPGAEEEILADLRWLGLDWDEGPDRGGPYGPYRQSERTPLYAQAARRLSESGAAYECFCSPEELAERRAAALARGEPPRYDGRCRNLSPAERERRRAELAAVGRRPALRFRLPEEDREIAVRDLIHGTTVFHTRDLDDFLLVRPNGTPLYNFAVVVDDWSMAITHVLRAEEHLSNTPRQLLLFEALGAEAPVFAHLPMLMGPGRRKLSKREQAVSVREYREEGYLPEALLNFLALLGWSDPEGRELLTKEELLQAFSLDRVGKAGAVFDPEQLAWLNRQHLRGLAPADLWKRLFPFLEPPEGLLWPPEESELQRLQNAAAVLREDGSTLSALARALEPYFGGVHPPHEPEADRLLQAKHVPVVLNKASAALAQLSEADWRPELLSAALHRLPAELDLRPGQVFRPLRAALTGRTSGPELPVAVWLLGRPLALARLGAVRLS